MAYRLWDGSDWGSENLLGSFAEGSFNTAENGDHFFGEAVVNLTSSGLFPTGQCVNFGSAYLKSRASNEFNSKMKDFIAPTPIFISNCGKVLIHKDTVPNTDSDFSFTAAGTGLSPFSLDDDGDAARIELPRTGLNIGLGLMVALALIGGGSGSCGGTAGPRPPKGS